MAEEYYDIQAKCKVCGADLTTSVHKECSNEWRDKLLGLITCDRCMRRYSGSVRNELYVENETRRTVAPHVERELELDPF